MSEAKSDVALLLESTARYIIAVALAWAGYQMARAGNKSTCAFFLIGAFLMWWRVSKKSVGSNRIS